MSKHRKKQNQKKAPPPLQGDAAQSDVRVMTATAATQNSPGATVISAAVQKSTKSSDQESNWFEHLKIALQFIGVVIAIVALVASSKSCSTARESLALSQQQAEENRRYHQEQVKPDVRVVVRHSSSPSQHDNAMAAEVVVWNNGPIKAVSLTGTYRVYVLDPTNYYVFASMGISEPLVDYSFSLSELKQPPDNYVKQILSAGSPALYVVNLTYYRETDMEQYSAEDYFLFDNGAYYDRESFKGRTNYHSIMDSLLLKMRCEAQVGNNKYRIVDPPPPGMVSFNMNVLNVPEKSSSEWGPVISNWTTKVAADAKNPELYVMRGMSFHLMHKPKQAISDYEQAIDLGSTNFMCYCNLAIIRSTSTNAVLRNGGEAVKLAKRACELTGWKEWASISSLAGAYAETGDFALAVKYQQQALSMPGMLPLERDEEGRALARMLNHLPLREDAVW
jgi:tetratricopeptide (TPR) repeat protein